MNATAITNAIRGVILGTLGSVRTVPAGDWTEGVPAQFGVHGGLDADTARRGRAAGKRLFDVELTPPRRTNALGPSTANIHLLGISARIVLWLPITLVAETHSANHRYGARADALEQVRVISDALEWPGNLRVDGEGTETGLVSQRLAEAAPPRIVREDWSTGLFEIELRFAGHVQRTVPIPVSALLTEAGDTLITESGDTLITEIAA